MLKCIIPKFGFLKTGREICSNGTKRLQIVQRLKGLFVLRFVAPNFVWKTIAFDRGFYTVRANFLMRTTGVVFDLTPCAASIKQYNKILGSPEALGPKKHNNV